MPKTCPTCGRTNPDRAAHCFFDGVNLVHVRPRQPLRDIVHRTPPPSSWRRLTAYAADCVVLWAPCALAWWLAEDATAALILVAGISALYFVGGLFLTGRTIGKRLTGYHIETTDGGSVGFLRALIRWLGFMLCWCVFGAGFAVALLHEDARGLHDWIAGTRPVSDDDAVVSETAE